MIVTIAEVAAMIAICPPAGQTAAMIAAMALASVGKAMFSTVGVADIGAATAKSAFKVVVGSELINGNGSN